MADEDSRARSASGKNKNKNRNEKKRNEKKRKEKTWKFSTRNQPRLADTRVKEENNITIMFEHALAATHWRNEINIEGIRPELQPFSANWDHTIRRQDGCC